MKNLYQYTTKWACICLVWAGMAAPPTAGAQTIPDVQWIKNGRVLVVTTDGNIVSSVNVPLGTPIPFFSGVEVSKYTPDGSQLWKRQLNGITPLTGLAAGNGLSVAPLGSIVTIAPNSTGGIGLIGSEFGTGTFLYGQLDIGGNGSLSGNPQINDFVQLPRTFNNQTFYEDMVGTPDGGFVLLVTSVELSAKSIVFVRKYAANSQTVWTKTIAFPTPNPATPDRSLTRGRTIINTPDGGFLLAGFYNTTGNPAAPQSGWVAKLNGEGDVVWQKLLDGLPTNAGPGSIAAMQSVSDAMLAADGNGYALAGVGMGPSSLGSSLATALVELNADGSFKRARAVGTDPNPPTQTSIARYSSGGQDYYAVGTSTGGQPQILLVNPNTLNVANQRTFTNSPAFGALTALAVAGDGSLVFNTANSALVKLRAETPGGFALLQPTYNCQTGAITFNTSGGDGSPIIYSAPGIMRGSPTSNSGTVEAGLRADPKTIPITGTQNGQTSTIVFDLAAFCSATPPPPGFNLLAPTYNCQTGAITFNTSGGNGSPITFSAPGIARSSATSNVGTVEAGLRADPKTIPITAMQNGQTSAFVFDLPGLCGRQARIASPEDRAGLQAIVLPNPVMGSELVIDVTGAKSQAVNFALTDATGRILTNQRAVVTTDRYRQTLPVGHLSGGVYLLRVSSDSETKVIKVVKQ